MKQRKSWRLMLAVVLTFGLAFIGCDLSDEADDFIKSNIPSVNSITNDVLNQASAAVNQDGIVNDASVDGAFINLNAAGRPIAVMGILTCPAAGLAGDLSNACITGGSISIDCLLPTITVTFNDCKWTTDDGWNGTIVITENPLNFLIAVDIDLTGFKTVLETFYYYSTGVDLWIKIKEISSTVLLFLGVEGGAGSCDAEVTVDMVTGDWTSDTGCGLSASGDFIPDIK